MNPVRSRDETTMRLKSKEALIHMQHKQQAKKNSVNSFLPQTSNGVKNIKRVTIGIIGTSFRGEVTHELEKRCVATLLKNGLTKSQIKMVRVPGAFEVPLAAKMMAKSKKYDALIAFGAIVKGKTYHFEQIANECSRGCAEVSRECEIPVIFEVLAVYDFADALDRATRKTDNKGVEAAETALTMIKLMSEI